MSIPTIAVSGVNLPFIQYQGQPVVTFAMIDAAHSRPERTARRNFTANKQHFIEGEDFYRVDFKRWHEFRATYSELFPESTTRLTLFTETGYLMLVKSFTDDLAWQVQRQLVKSYFRTKPSQQVATAEPRDPTVIDCYQKEEMRKLVEETLPEYLCRGFSGYNRAYNLLRIRYNLRRIDDLPAKHFDEAMDTIRAMKPLVEQYVHLQRFLSDSFFTEVIGEGEPLTAWICRHAGGAQHIPAKPDWKAIAHQVMIKKGLLQRP